jgi:hypothetical protein
VGRSFSVGFDLGGLVHETDHTLKMESFCSIDFKLVLKVQQMQEKI